MSDMQMFNKNFLIFDALTDEPFSYHQAYVDILGSHTTSLILSYCCQVTKEGKDCGFILDLSEVGQELKVKYKDMIRSVNKLKEIKILENKKGTDDYTLNFKVLFDLLAHRQEQKLTRWTHGD